MNYLKETKLTGTDLLLIELRLIRQALGLLLVRELRNDNIRDDAERARWTEERLFVDELLA